MYGNNSLVGASKILHFINPDVYVIWDSRVCSFLKELSEKPCNVTSIKYYWSYLDLCKEVSLDPKFQPVHEKNKTKLGYEITPMRTVEQIMFIGSKHVNSLFESTQ